MIVIAAFVFALGGLMVAILAAQPHRIPTGMAGPVLVGYLVGTVVLSLYVLASIVGVR